MKKLMIALDAEKPGRQSIAFGCYFARLTGSVLTGVFLENFPAESAPGVKFTYGGVFAETIDLSDLPEIEFKRKACSENIREFRAICEDQGISYKVHCDQGAPGDELIAESRYADAIIAGSGWL